MRISLLSPESSALAQEILLAFNFPKAIQPQITIKELNLVSLIF